METLELGPRLRAIADRIPPDCHTLADIGTDHGYIPVEGLLAGRIRRAIASDAASGPLDRARGTAKRFGVEESVDFRLGDGLTVLKPDEADVTVIAGMGGDNIVGILAAAPWSREGGLLLLQPMSRAEVLRRWLPEHGYALEAERLAEDKGVIYPILTVRGGPARPLSEAAAGGGLLLPLDRRGGDYLAGRIRRLPTAAAGLEKARDPALARRREGFLQVIAELETRKGEWVRADRARDRKRSI